ncbi:oligosaccharide flippase family protein, partial [Candidatus Roizmanbacteria bacterium]|nr:oligosaccharide flippase family protein [Candidatus Roizmanbacteria bacterium]
SHTLFRGSAIMFIGTTIVNAGNYLFHLLMGRMLGPSGYGILESIISSMYILSIVPLALNLAIVKFVSSAKGKDKEEEISAFYYWSRQKVIIFGFVAAVFLVLLLPFWLKFLQLNDFRLLLFSVLAFPFSLLLLVVRSFFTGVLDFISYSFSTIIEVVLKIILTVLFVAAGWSVLGVVVGLFVSGIITYLFSVRLLKFQKNGQQQDFSQTKELIIYALPAMLAVFSFYSLFSTDIILVKHFFSSFEAGIYASLSVLGKIIFFASSSFVSVMFPLISQRHAQGERYRHLFWLTLIIVAISSICISALYYFFPKLMIEILFGSKYLSGANLLFLFGIFLSLYSISNVVINFFLSIGKTKVVVISLAAALLQIFLITLWHNNLTTVINDSIVTTFILLVSLLLYYPYATKK